MELERCRCGYSPTQQKDRKAGGHLWAVPSKAWWKLALFTGKARPICSDGIYKMWEDLLQMSDVAQRNVQLQKIGNYKFEQFEIIPSRCSLKWWQTQRSSQTGRSPVGTVGPHTPATACKQEQPCK